MIFFSPSFSHSPIDRSNFLLMHWFHLSIALFLFLYLRGASRMLSSKSVRWVYRTTGPVQTDGDGVYLSGRVHSLKVVPRMTPNVHSRETRFISRQIERVACHVTQIPGRRKSLFKSRPDRSSTIAFRIGGGWSERDGYPLSKGAVIQ